MTKTTKHRLIIFVLVILLLYIFGIFANRRIDKVYNSVISNISLINSIESKNHVLVDSISRDNKLEYSQFKNYAQTSKSSESIPDINAIAYQEAIESSVKLSSLDEYLSQNRPYIKWYKGKMWEIIPIFPINSNGDGYILFKKVIL